MIQHDPADRPAASTVLKHPFFWDRERQLMFFQVRAPCASRPVRFKIVAVFHRGYMRVAMVTGRERPDREAGPGRLRGAVPGARGTQRRHGGLEEAHHGGAAARPAQVPRLQGQLRARPRARHEEQGACLCVCVCVCVCVYIYIYIYMCVCMFVYVCVCEHVCGFLVLCSPLGLPTLLPAISAKCSRWWWQLYFPRQLRRQQDRTSSMRLCSCLWFQ